MFKYSVEFLGTSLLIFVILVSSGNPIMIGAALAAAVAAGGSISGGHFNPAVSVMAMVKGDLSTADFMGYVLSQVLGGLFALEMSKRM